MFSHVSKENYPKQYRELYTEGQWFSSVHDLFERNTIANTIIYREKIAAKLPEHFGKEFYSKQFTLLDIGGGNGKRSEFILQSLLEQPNQIRIDYNDISKYQYRKYQSVLSENLNEVFLGDFDTIDINKTYHFILCIHTLYGCIDWNSDDADKNSLVKIRRLLAPKGLACIIIRDKNNISHFIQNRFKDYIGIIDSTICAEEIFQVLQKFNIPYDFDEAHSITPQEELFGNNGLSDLSKNFISFFMHKKFDAILPEYIEIVTAEIKKRAHKFEIDSSKIIWIYS
ncbi:MAG: class I SAM-dependent methyltransferase [Planctomycetes bacterium]|nr:class I SAM-dependent methyltransferase [Planctomycetota bacterium]